MSAAALDVGAKDDPGETFVAVRHRRREPIIVAAYFNVTNEAMSGAGSTIEVLGRGRSGSL